MTPTKKNALPAASEADLQRAVMAWLTKRCIKHWRMPLGAIMHQVNGNMIWKKNPLKGFPDIAGVLKRRDKGRFFAIELKTAKGRLSPEQTYWQMALAETGAAVAVIRSIEDLEAFFDEHGELARPMSLGA